MVAGALTLGFTSCSDDWLSLSDPNQETADTFWRQPTSLSKVSRLPIPPGVVLDSLAVGSRYT